MKKFVLALGASIAVEMLALSAPVMADDSSGHRDPKSETEEIYQLSALEHIQKRNETLPEWAKLQTLLTQPKEISWLFTGDSITHGANTSEGLRRFSEYINQYLHSTKINGIQRDTDLVMNTGVANSTTRYLKETFTESVLNKNADVVFITLGMNDSADAGHSERVEQDVYKENLEYFVEQIRNAGGIPILQTQNYPTDGKHASFDTWMQTVRDVASEKAVILIDVHQFWNDVHTKDNKDGWMHSDGVHPTAQGYMEWAKFLLQQLDMWEEESELANTATAYVERYGSPLTDVQVESNMPEVLKHKPPHNTDVLLIQSDGGAGACAADIYDEHATELAQAAEQNITVRFKADSGQDGTLISFADKDSPKQLRLDIVGGKFKIQRQYSTGKLDGFTLSKPSVADGRFHTVSVNIADGLAHYYLDGTKVLSLDKKYVVGATSLSLSAFDIDYVTLCGVRTGTDSDAPATNEFKGVLDYAAVTKRLLKDEEIVQQTEASSSVNSAISQYIHNGKGKPNTWVFLGSDTLYGGSGDISAKSAVEVFDEVVRWECNGNACDNNATNLRLEARSRFVVNSSYSGYTTADMLENFDTHVAPLKAEVLYLIPDVLNPQGAAREDETTFTHNIKAILEKAETAGMTVVLVTPPQADDEADSYAEAMLKIAGEESLPLIDAHQYLQKLKKANTHYSDIVDEKGNLNHKGQLLLGKFLLKESGMPVPAGRRIASLEYYDAAAHAPSDAVFTVTPSVFKVTDTSGKEVTRSEGSYQIGDHIYFDYSVDRSALSGTIGVKAVYGAGLENFIDKCKWSKWADSLKSTHCTFGYHVVQETDLARGYFEPVTMWIANAGGIVGNSANLGSVRVKGPKVMLKVPTPKPEVPIELTVDPASAEGTVGTAFEAVSVTSTVDPDKDYTVSFSPDLPAGLHYRDGKIQGIPSEAFDGTITITLVQGSQEKTATLDLKIDPKPTVGSSTPKPADGKVKLVSVKKTPATGSDLMIAGVTALVLLGAGAAGLALRRRCS